MTVFIALISAFGTDGGSTPFYGVHQPEDLLERCVRMTAERVRETDCVKPHDGRISGVVQTEEDCPQLATASFGIEVRSKRWVACVTPTDVSLPNRG